MYGGPAINPIRALILLIKHDKLLYIDVTCVNPTSKTYVNNISRTEKLHSLKARIRIKHQRYADICAANKYHFTAFAVETYGGLATESIALLRIIADASTAGSFGHLATTRSSREFLRHAHSALNIEH